MNQTVLISKIFQTAPKLITDFLQSREVLADHEEEEYEQYAISEKWHLENGRRWARIDETESSLDSPALENKIIMGCTRVEVCWP